MFSYIKLKDQTIQTIDIKPILQQPEETLNWITSNVGIRNWLAGSGKTESVVYGFLKHFQKESFCVIIHDYKDFELTEMAYQLFKRFRYYHKLKIAATTLEIVLLDHLIITKDGYYSLADNNGELQ